MSRRRSRNLWHRTYEKYFAKANEYKGVHLIGFWTTGSNTFCQTLKRPILKIDDFQGLKIWTATPNMAATIQHFGATPVLGMQMFDAMSGGIVDGAVAGKGALISFQLFRYTQGDNLLPRPARLYAAILFYEPEEIRQPRAPKDAAL